jgi:hypothetical protein
MHPLRPLFLLQFLLQFLFLFLLPPLHRSPCR